MSIPVALQFDIYYLDLLFSTTILVSLFRQMKIRFTCNNTDRGNLNNGYYQVTNKRVCSLNYFGLFYTLLAFIVKLLNKLFLEFFHPTWCIDILNGVLLAQTQSKVIQNIFLNSRPISNGVLGLGCHDRPESSNENREVLVYEHFVGDNSCLKLIIKFKRRKKVFLPLFNETS